jgi:hypothetical protein
MAHGAQHENGKPYYRIAEDSLELPLPLCPAELSERINSRFVPLLQRLQVQIPGAPTTHNGAARAAVEVETLQVSHLSRGYFLLRANQLHSK